MIKTFVCKQCGIGFERNYSDSLLGPNQRMTFEFCSRQCSSKSRISRCELECLQCGTKFKVWKSKAKTSKFCSRACLGLSNGQRNKGISVNKGIPWNKGLKGKQVAWNKGKQYLQIRGENNPNWKGGVTGERHASMGRIEYKQWRLAVFERDNYTCTVCDKHGCELHADHIKPWKDYPELRFELSNGRTLCRTCHYYVTFKRSMPVGSNWATARTRRLS